MPEEGCMFSIAAPVVIIVISSLTLIASLVTLYFIRLHKSLLYL